MTNDDSEFLRIADEAAADRRETERLRGVVVEMKPREITILIHGHQ